MTTTLEELIRSGVTRITGSDEQKAVDVQEVAGNNRLLVESTRIVNDFAHTHLTITDTASILRVGASNLTDRRGIFLQNNSGESVYFGNSDVSSSNGMVLMAGMGIFLAISGAKDLYGVCESGLTSTLYVMEVN